MSISSISEKPNNCDTCEKIKKNEFEKLSSSYSSDCDESYSSNSVKSSTNQESLHLDCDHSLEEKSKNSSRRFIQQNKTFSSEKIREIERRNALLVDKILYHSRRPNQHKPFNTYPPQKMTSSEINRKRHQEKISRENQILLKKIQSVKPSVKYR